MKTWYDIVCDDHKEYCPIFVKSNYWIFDYTKSYLGDIEKDIHTWLGLHYGCKLRILHDNQNEELYEKKYTKAVKLL